jgi:hypothetical protein
LRASVVVAGCVFVAIVASCSAFGGGESSTSSSSSSGSSGSSGGSEAGTSSGQPTSDGGGDGGGGGAGRDGSTKAVPCIVTNNCTGIQNCCVNDQIDTSTCRETCGTDPLVACDDTSDCKEGFVCCIDLEGGDNNDLIGSTCRPSCPGGPASERACKLSFDDCADIGKVCVHIKTTRALRPPYPFFVCN